jgi:hypothetical protein
LPPYDPVARQRGRRFDLCLPVWYRAAGEALWHAGITENVSASGVLIRGEGPVAPARPIVVAIALPSASGCLVGRGSIVRTVEGSVHTTLATFAIAVRRFHIDHWKSVLPRLTR